MDSLKSKLPVKRKTPEFPTPFSPVPRPPPFKFHRIWTEPDEIRFLQGLLNSFSDKLVFPRDLNVFYARFSDSMSQPYTRSQLSEKLRRLRKKFRVISARLDKGLDFVLLSPHDRALYNLSKQLWHPGFSSSSPFSVSNCGGNSFDNQEYCVRDEKTGLVGVEVKFLPDLEVKCEDIEYDGVEDTFVFEGVDVDEGVEVKLSEVDVKFEDCVDIGDDGFFDSHGIEFSGCNGDVEGNGFGVFGGTEEKVKQNGGGNGIKVEEEMAGCDLSVKEVDGGPAKIVMNVFIEALDEVTKGLVNDDMMTDNEQRFEKEWHEQRVAELDCFAQRMRLIIENSMQKI